MFRGFLAGLVLFVCLLAPITTEAAARNKIIFISDLHMNVDASYSWLVSNTADLAAFLGDLNTRQDVSEVVILGDLLDDWVCPVKNTPQTFNLILAAANNSQIVAALQALCANPEIQVTYVTGNHDSLSFESANQAVILAVFPGMKIASDSPGMGSYTKNEVIWAEHGHRYCLFNAPDTWSISGRHLPLGYFISRMAATKSLNDGQVSTTPQILDDFVKAQAEIRADQARLTGTFFDDAFILAVFNAIALWSGTAPWDRFKMDDLDGFSPDPSVEGTALDHDAVYSGWPTRWDRVTKEEAVWNELGGLTSAANLIFEMPAYIKSDYPFTPRIILFGHTHQAVFQHHSGDVETVYVNTGTWIDGKPKTWVEIAVSDGDNGTTQYQVALWYYGETTARHLASLEVTHEKTVFPGRSQ